MSDLTLDDLEVGPVSNVSPGMLSEEELAAAASATEERIAAGFDAEGNVGGPYSKESPPPGKLFGGFHKGATGITWVSERSAPHADDVQSGSVLLMIGLSCEQQWSTIRWHSFRVAKRATMWELFEDSKQVVRAEAEAAHGIAALGTPDGWAWVHLACSLHTFISLLPGPPPDKRPEKLADAAIFSCVSPTEENCGSMPLGELRVSGPPLPWWRGGGAASRPLRDGDYLYIQVARD
jgi:hypothetical protein